MLPTPQYNLSNYPQVYEPSEDTFLFLDGLEREVQFLTDVLKPKLAVEIGSGSGVIVTALSKLLHNRCICFATDINSQACIATSNTSKLNNSSVDCVNMDLISGFRENLFDVILFNPPYVVTESSEVRGTGLSRAWAGGIDGREITDKLLSNLKNLLADEGVCYMVLLKENNIQRIHQDMLGENFNSEVVIERKIPGEHLYVMKFRQYNKKYAT